MSDDDESFWVKDINQCDDILLAVADYRSDAANNNVDDEPDDAGDFNDDVTVTKSQRYIIVCTANLLIWIDKMRG